DGSPGTLRYEIGQANATAGDNLINVAVTGTITLSGTQLELNDTSGDPKQTIEITGPGANLLSVSGNQASPVFQIDGGVTATISGLTITKGNSAGSANNGGGGLFNEGTLTLTNCTVSGNTCLGPDTVATIGGGGLFNEGTVMLTNCTVSGNTSGDNTL